MLPAPSIPVLPEVKVYCSSCVTLSLSDGRSGVYILNIETPEPNQLAYNIEMI